MTARQQTAGRGRRGNAWISAPGNLYATLLVSDPASPENAPELSFVAALAVHDAIVDRAAALREKLALKWPNDVLYDGQKLAGILIESETIAGRLAVAIGIGVNCMHHPVDTAYPATDLADGRRGRVRRRLVRRLSGAMTRRLAHWHRGAGFQPFAPIGSIVPRGIGGEMRVRLPDHREFVGRAEALDERGRLAAAPR